MSERLQPKRFGKTKLAGGILAGALALSYVGDKLGIDIPAVESEMTQEVEEPTVKITKIEPIDIGCFVNVESEVRLAGHERARIKVGPFSKTGWTNTTEKDLKGESMLCVDNEFTDITLIENSVKGTKDLHVVIGNVYPYGRINHDGQDGADYNPAFGQRLGTFGSPDNDSAVAGLDLIGQTLIERSACVDEAVTVAKEGIKNHYELLAQQIGSGTINSVTIEYLRTPVAEPMPVGRANDQLERMGFEISDNFDIDVMAPVCNVTTINGDPAVEGY